jgi:hypothetical protein
MTFVIQVVVLVLCFIFRNHQPLKSREWFPVGYMCFKLFEQMVGAAGIVPAHYFSSNVFIGTQVICFLQVWAVTPVIIAILALLILQFLRWIALGMLTKRKEQKAKQKLDEYSFDTSTETQNAGDVTARRLKKANVEDAAVVPLNGPNTQNMKFIQFFLTKKSFVLWVGLILLTVYIVGAIHLIVYKGVCSLLEFHYVLELIFILSLYTILIVLALGDFIINGLMRLHFSCSKRWIDELLFDDDPLVFRMEAYAIIFILTCQCVVETTNVMLSIFVPSAAVLFHEIGQIATGQLVGLLATPGVPLIFAILWYARSKNRGKGPLEDGVIDLAIYNRCEETITQILSSSDKKLAEMFKSFTMKEFSIENVLLYYDIQKYKAMSERNKIKFVQYLYETYVDEKSSLQVNLPKQTIDDLKKKTLQVAETKQIPENLYDGMMVELNQNLLDTYSRFFDSKEFKQYLLSGST